MTSDERDMLVESVKRHEGFRARAYQDTLGHWTIGYGTLLETLEIDTDQAEDWLLERLHHSEDGVAAMDGYQDAGAARQAVLVEMAYQLGVRGCLRFFRMWSAIADLDWTAAAREMLDSRWAKQTPGRVAELAARLQYGTWDGHRPGEV